MHNQLPCSEHKVLLAEIASSVQIVVAVFVKVLSQLFEAQGLFDFISASVDELGFVYMTLSVGACIFAPDFVILVTSEFAFWAL